jgi:hypothetical protein
MAGEDQVGLLVLWGNHCEAQILIEGLHCEATGRTKLKRECGEQVKQG